jgi:very-short-patch-repair endonuclease
MRVNGVLVHTTDRLGRAEAASLDGIRVTSPMRTLLDLAEVVEPELLELATDNFWRRGLIHPRRLSIYLDDDWCRHHRGTAWLRELVAGRVGDRPTGSTIETLLFQLLRDHNVPLPTRQHPVVTPFGVRYLDFAYVEPKIAIELDGRENHMNPDVFLDDRDRQNLIEEQGWTFRRFGHAHVTRDAIWTVFTIASALRLKPVRWKRR